MKTHLIAMAALFVSPLSPITPSTACEDTRSDSESAEKKFDQTYSRTLLLSRHFLENESGKAQPFRLPSLNEVWMYPADSCGVLTPHERGTPPNPELIKMLCDNEKNAKLAGACEWGVRINIDRAKKGLPPLFSGSEIYFFETCYCLVMNLTTLCKAEEEKHLIGVSKKGSFEFRVGKLVSTIQQWSCKLPQDEGLKDLLEALQCKSIEDLSRLDKKDQQQRVQKAIAFVPPSSNGGFAKESINDDVKALIKHFYQATNEAGRFNPLDFYQDPKKDETLGRIARCFHILEGLMQQGDTIPSYFRKLSQERKKAC